VWRPSPTPSRRFQTRVPGHPDVLSVALTGNIASGKSSVAARWSEFGVPVNSADELAREAVAPETEGLREVIDEFGEGVLDPDGTLNRASLREIVFSDEPSRARLERILHPRIGALRDRWLDDRRREGFKLVVSEVPLLFETDTQGDFDTVVLVDAHSIVRRARIVRGRGLDEADAQRIIDAQMDSELKRQGSEFFIDNYASEDELNALADLILGRLRAKAGVESMLIDMHLHTAGSWDCQSDPERVLERALAKGYERIAITDHNRVHVGLRMAEMYPDRIIPGEEVKTGEGIDVIGLYLSEEIPQGTSAEETIERIRDQGGIPYLPHPYAGGKGGGGKYAELLGPLCDVVEVFNARLHSQRANALASELAHRTGTLRGAGSDAHTVGEVGNAYVDLPQHPNRPEALLGALRSAGTGGRESSRFVHLASTWAKVGKKLPGGRSL
jgi:dephospho-CoA kinase